MLIFNIMIAFSIVCLSYVVYYLQQADKIKGKVFKKMINIVEDIDKRLKELEKINQEKEKCL